MSTPPRGCPPFRTRSRPRPSPCSPTAACGPGAVPTEKAPAICTWSGWNGRRRPGSSSQTGVGGGRHTSRPAPAPLRGRRTATGEVGVGRGTLAGSCPVGCREPPYDAPMTASARTGSERNSARWAWLVLVVLAGVLGMHALSPAGMPAAGRHDVTVSVESSDHHAALVPGAGDDRRYPSDVGSGSMVMGHVGGTCATDGVSVACVPPALMPAVAARVEPAAAACRGPAVRTVDGRAPPDLSELQLLRI